ncbi:uncharacterized protein (DUF58 family) [Stackebrandtia endophytica]|uniref:Uncharacterized protein (DUF58 family) n=1 Tax=Stackebrandtia endophytica TaxID=1496996 RepID=A0A543ASC7_9ACTN|nr:DUF58 domain-containing protein [Stackebrandtia endophytica]TQL75480.1 uncharacterized protein (DUF58 family) [Stackebrandtia endophytica]
MGEAFRGLTIRGKALLTVGVTLALLALLLGEKDLLRVAILIGILPILAATVLARSRYQIVASRTLDPIRVEVGQTARVTLRLRNLSRMPTGTMMLEDRIPYTLGERPRLVLERLLGGGTSAVSYSVRAEQRGQYDIGPLIIGLTDPFGLIEMTRTYPSSDHLTVIPRITALPAIRLPGEYAGNGDNRSRAVAVHGEDDAATREYRHGDDLRRVHWKSTARTGELMVRREEQPWDSRATIAMDLRTAGFRGEGPSSSFEWAVGATASVANHLRMGGYQLRMVSESVDLAADATGQGTVLDHLAAVNSRRNGSITAMVERLRRGDHGGLILGVFGLMNDEEALQVAALRATGSACIAILIDSSTWMQLPEEARTEADQAFQRTMLALLRAGWRVIPIRFGDRLDHLWRSLATGPQGFSSRAAMAETVSGGPR